MSRTPGFFYLFAIVCAGFALCMVGAFLFGSFSPDRWGLAVRGLAALLAGLSALSAEALWHARPWAARVTTALGVAMVAGMLAWSNPLNWQAALVLAGTLILPAVRAVRAETRKLWPRTAAVVPAQPVPVPVNRP